MRIGKFRARLEALFELRPVRFAAAALLLCRGGCYLLLGRQYRAMNDLCWVVRVSRVPFLERIARHYVFDAIRSIRRSGPGELIESFRADRAGAQYAAAYSLDRTGTNDIFRDLIVLKQATATEKGVILLKYARTFSAVIALFDVARLMERYLFVLEPCWSGYCDPSVLMFISPGNPVIVQCFTEEDHQFIASVGAPLVPIRLGPADWVDADIFRPPQAREKPYDLVMVANWAAHKRHAQLFRALSKITDRKIRVLLIGFAWADRTAQDIRREAAAHRNDLVQIDILERVPQAELAGYVSQSKVFVFLSKKEGDNKALVEAMFADVPAIVYDKTIGGARSRVNASTGVLASDEELDRKVRYMLDRYTDFAPRRWALEHTGSAIATRVLDQAVKQAGGLTSSIVEKTNAPNLAYKDVACRSSFQQDYEFIVACSRHGSARQ